MYSDSCLKAGRSSKIHSFYFINIVNLSPGKWESYISSMMPHRPLALRLSPSPGHGKSDESKVGVWPQSILGLVQGDGGDE